MNTGCQGPFRFGTGGWCGCNCNCCPPECCSVVTVYFDCGAIRDEDNPEGCDPPMASWTGLKLPGPPQPMPEFSNEPVLSSDSRFIFGEGMGSCSAPCETIPVPIACGGGPTPCCCLEILPDNRIRVVGNGYIAVPDAIIAANSCGSYTPKINGQNSPLFVYDGQIVTVTLEPEIECCTCYEVDVRCGPPESTSFSFKPAKRQWKSRTLGKLRVNPETGKPYVALNKEEIMRRLRNRFKR